MSTKAPVFTVTQVTPQVRIGIAAARFNSEVVEDLLKGCLKRLKELGLGKDQIEIYRVPGAFELPLTAQTMAKTRRFDAIICLGAVIRGETPHFEYVAEECARGVADVSLAEGLPVVFGVLTTNTEQQAWDRCGGKHGHNGLKAAEAALEMIGVLHVIRRHN
jgi:6,7-dimethyl-8-ribityllumazine synthase